MPTPSAFDEIKTRVVGTVMDDSQSLQLQMHPQSAEGQDVGVAEPPIWPVIGQQDDVLATQQFAGQDLGQVVDVPVRG